MIVRESMRRFPPAPTFARQSIEDTTVGEWDMPKGSLITVSPGRKVSSAIASKSLALNADVRDFRAFGRIDHAAKRVFLAGVLASGRKLNSRGLPRVDWRNEPNFLPPSERIGDLQIP